MSIIPESQSVMIDRYAEILVTHAVSLRPGQDVFIRGPEPLHEFGLRVGQAAYEHGARSVNYHFPSQEELYQLITSGTRHQTSLYHDACREYIANVFKRNAAMICLISNLQPPDNHRSLPQSHPDNYAFFMRGMSEVNDSFGKYALKFPKTTAPVATQKWALNVFSNEERPLEVLWSAILRLASADSEDYQRALKDREERLRQRMERLNDLGVRELLLKSEDVSLTLGIVKGSRWVGSHLETKGNSQEYLHTFPSVDTFTVPDCRLAQGTVGSCLPLRLPNRSVIKGLSVEFENGKIVDFEASDGAESFGEWIDVDLGSRFLGEVGLVGNDSPFYGQGDCFDFPPFNRNVASYISVGGSTPWARPTREMTDTELNEAGCNKSAIHADLIIGSPDLSVIATKTSHGEVPILEGGQWCGPLSDV